MKVVEMNGSNVLKMMCWNVTGSGFGLNTVVTNTIGTLSIVVVTMFRRNFDPVINICMYVYLDGQTRGRDTHMKMKTLQNVCLP